jgi:hypothetical protein
VGSACGMQKGGKKRVSVCGNLNKIHDLKVICIDMRTVLKRVVKK